MNRRSKYMYCVRVTLHLMGDAEPCQKFLRWRNDIHNNSYTDDSKEARFWLYENNALVWAQQHRHLSAEVVKVVRDDEVLKAQKELGRTRGW